MSDLGVDLRYGIPPFRFAMPPGWVQVAPTEATKQDELKQASAIFRRAGRPDLEAEYRAMMAQVSEGMRRTKVFTVYRQQDVPMEELLPLSITASALSGTDGDNLDDWVADAFRLRGAEFLNEEMKHIVRWVSEPRRPQGAAPITGVGGRTITYLIPVPGTGRSKALVFTSTIVIPEGEVIPEDSLRGIELLSDAMISTFAWEKLVEEPVVLDGPTAAESTQSPS